MSSEQHIYKIHNKGWSNGMDNQDHQSSSSPGPPHLKCPQVGTVECWPFLRSSLSLELLYSEGGPWDGLGGWKSSIESGCGQGEGALIGGPRQRLEEVVEQTGAQSFVHPITGQEHVVNLVHALDVARAVSLLGLKA